MCKYHRQDRKVMGGCLLGGRRSLLLLSACQSVIGHDTEPQTAPEGCSISVSICEVLSED